MARDVTDHEIVDSVIDSKTNAIKWTIHQPRRRGWYLRLRSPAFPPGACISLLPPPSSTGEPILMFGCQTIDPASVPPPVANRFSSDHSYPPSRTSTSSQTSLPPANATPKSPLSRPPYPRDGDSEATLTEIQERTVSISLDDESAPGQDIGERETSYSTTALPSSQPRPPSSNPIQRASPQLRWHVTHYTLRPGQPTTGVLAGTHHHPHLVHPPSHAPQTSFLHRALAPLANLSHAATGSTAHHFIVQPSPPPPQTTTPHASGASPNPSTIPANKDKRGTSLDVDRKSDRGEGVAAALADPTNRSPDPSTSPQTNPSLSTAPCAQSIIVAEDVPKPPLISFTDTTPLLRATPSGTLSIDVETIKHLGVEMAFWVAVSLAYLDFLRERDGYLAASED